jgi:hypothetical protein
MTVRPGNTNRREKHSTIDLLKGILYCKKGKQFFQHKNELIQTSRSVVLSLSLKWGFPGQTYLLKGRGYKECIVLSVTVISKLAFYG